MSVAMFTRDNAAPFSEAQLDHVLKVILADALPPATARLYTWHSARIFLATVLAEHGASDRQIQALCRWQTDESLKIYVRLNSLKYKTLLDGAMAANVSTARANQLCHALPFIDLRDVFNPSNTDYGLSHDAAVLALDAAVHPDDDADDDDLDPDGLPPCTPVSNRARNRAPASLSDVPGTPQTPTPATTLVDVGEDESIQVLLDDPAGLTGQTVRIPDRAWPEFADAPPHQATTSTIVGPTVLNPSKYAVDAAGVLYLFSKSDLLRYMGKSKRDSILRKRKRALP